MLHPANQLIYYKNVLRSINTYMNYKKLYNKIIQRGIDRALKKQDNTELHHAIPRCIGGEDSEPNLVRLTTREHFICHFLLTKMYERETYEWYKLTHAFMMMKSSSLNQSRYFNSRLYEALRSNFSEVMSISQSGIRNSIYGTIWICNKLLKRNKKILKREPIPNGWEAGRVINWNKKTHLICPVCNKQFVITGRTKFCSAKCRKQSYIKNSPTSKYRPKLTLISKSYNLTIGSVINNTGFILESLDNNIPKNQILWFLGCNNSGENYKTIQKLIN